MFARMVGGDGATKVGHVRRDRRRRDRRAGGIRMNGWREEFVERIAVVRRGVLGLFERFAGDTLTAAFDEIRSFTADHGLRGSAPVSQAGLRTFKFSVAENAYVLITFRPRGLDRIEVFSEFTVPNRPKVSPLYDSTELIEAGRVWAQRAFEQSLDRFAEVMAQALAHSCGSAASVDVAQTVESAPPVP